MTDDVRAELTLRIIRMAQERSTSCELNGAWTFVPDMRAVDWITGRQRLAAMSKPLLVGVLLCPGQLMTWPVAEIAEPHRAKLERERAILDEYFTEKLGVCGLGPSGAVRLEGGDAPLVLSRDEFMQWCREYLLLTVGLTARSTTEVDEARLVIYVPPEGSPPLGE
jgi:hypothetical protein